MSTPRPRRGQQLSAQQVQGISLSADKSGNLTGDGLVEFYNGPTGIQARLNINAIAARLGAVQLDMLGRVVSASAVEGGTFQWTYSVKPIIKASAGYGDAAWTDIDAAITCYNLAENFNDNVSDCEPYGNGVEKCDLEEIGTFILTPIPVGALVTVRKVAYRVEDADPIVEYWITGAGFPNGVTGDCEEA